MVYNFNCRIRKLKEFSRSEAVTYTEKVVTSWKRFKIETLVLQTTNSKCHMAHQIAPIQMTLSDFQGHSHIYLLRVFSNMIFV